MKYFLSFLGGVVCAVWLCPPQPTVEIDDMTRREIAYEVIEYLEQNDAWIDTYYNPLCLSCWHWTCQTILTEGDTLGEAYSVRLVAEEKCEAVFHESNHEVVAPF